MIAITHNLKIEELELKALKILVNAMDNYELNNNYIKLPYEEDLDEDLIQVLQELEMEVIQYCIDMYSIDIDLIYKGYCLRDDFVQIDYHDNEYFKN